MSENLTIEPLAEENFGDFVALMEKFAEYENLDPPDESSRRRLRKRIADLSTMQPMPLVSAWTSIHC